MEFLLNKLVRGFRLSHYLIRRHYMGKRLGWWYLLLPLALSYFISFIISFSWMMKAVK